MCSEQSEMSSSEQGALYTVALCKVEGGYDFGASRREDKYRTLLSEDYEFLFSFLPCLNI